MVAYQGITAARYEKSARNNFREPPVLRLHTDPEASSLTNDPTLSPFTTAPLVTVSPTLSLTNPRGEEEEEEEETSSEATLSYQDPADAHEPAQQGQEDPVLEAQF